MAFEHEQRAAIHLLRVVEDGTRSVEEARALYEEADPLLVYFLFTWLRNRYGADHPASEGVLGRMVGVVSTSPMVAKMMREGEKDSLVQWFEETYEYRELDREAFIELVVEKLEG